MHELGKSIFILGLTIAAIGLVIWAGAGVRWIGRLPGDIRVSRGSFTFYFPVVTCIAFSLIVSFFFWLFRSRH